MKRVTSHGSIATPETGAAASDVVATAAPSRRRAAGPTQHRAAPRPADRFERTTSAGRRAPQRLALVRQLAAHGLRLADVRLVATPSAARVGLETLLEMALEAHAAATRNAAFGNFSQRYIGATVRLAGGTTRTATNIEQTREINVCAERAAIVQAHQAELRRLPDHPTPAEVERQRQRMQVDVLVITGDGPLGGEHVCPCGECQSWLVTSKYYRPDTLVVGLQRDAQGKLEVHARRVDELLPHAFDGVAPYTRADVRSLPVEVSAEAKGVLDHQPVTRAALVEALAAAQRHHQQRGARDGNETVAAALTTCGEIFVGERHDWAARWFVPADQTALTLAQRARSQATRVAAVAYFGDEAGAPTPLSIGILARPQVGGPDTLIVCVEHDTVRVRALAEYCRGIFVSRDAVTAAASGACPSHSPGMPAA